MDDIQLEIQVTPWGWAWVLYTLVQLNIIMYADVTLPLTQVSNKLNVPTSHIFQWDKNCKSFQVYFWRNCATIMTVNFKNQISQEPISVPSVSSVLPNHNTVTNVDQICHWSTVSFSLVTNTEVALLPALSFHSCSGWLVWNHFPHSWKFIFVGISMI